MSDAAHYREQAARAQRLFNAQTDQLTRERLAALADEYRAKAQAVEAEERNRPPANL